MDAIEAGRVPDALTRFGIRRLLNMRRKSIASSREEPSIDEFVRATQAQPIAVVPQKANDQHYEVPAAFFQNVLGGRLKYSCCYWPKGVDSLDLAEDESLRITCEHANLEDGMDILELGCGWGSLSLWMAERFPNSRITSVSNSHSQREFIQERAAETGLTNLRVITADMNDFQPTEVFDRVMSVEMFEHMRNHRRLMSRINRWLWPDGRLFVHIFCHKDAPYLFRTDGALNWMGRHFFSGGMMPSCDLLERCGSPMSLENQWKWNGRHYAKTCRAWLKNQDKSLSLIEPILEQTYGAEEAIRWHQRWRLFFMACEELFAYNRGEEWFVSHYLFKPCPQS